MKHISSDNIDAAIELASTIISIGCTIQFGLAGGQLAGTISSIAGSKLQDRLQQRRVQRLFEQCADIVADRSIQFMANEYRELPENERSAAVLAVRDTLAKSNLSVQRTTAMDLNPIVIRESMHRVAQRILRSASLSTDAIELYNRVLNESCEYLVEFIATLPEFTPDALTELLRRESQILRELQQVLRRLPTSRALDDYSADYRRAVIRKLDRMELIGANFDAASKRYSLNVAYVSLQILRNEKIRPSANSRQLTVTTSTRVERALSTLKRVLVIGEAGSGKTTLLRWLAVSSATSSFGEGMSAWNETIPFLITLREFAEKDLPKPGDFPALIARSVSGEIPASWPHELLRQGKALVLVDGVDELPEGSRRNEAKEWLAELAETYPKARYVVTSRPAAVREVWPDKSFAIAELQPMSFDDIESFVERWYSAIWEELGVDENEDEFVAQQRTLLHVLETDHNLRRLAVNPLLCSLICALNRLREGQLPQDRMGIYGAALDMFLGRRDRERRIAAGPPIAADIQVVILQALAFWLIRQNLTTVSIERAEELIERELISVTGVGLDAQRVLRYLLERSGLVREPVVGQIDFIHRTFQDYLAGRAAVESDEIESLIENAERDNWRDVVVFAAGHAKLVQRDRLLQGLITNVEGATEPSRTRLSLITVACLQTVPQVNPELRARINDVARALLPPRNVEAAESLAAAGQLVIDVMQEHLPQSTAEAIASIRLASIVGGLDAMRLIALIASREKDVQTEVIRAQRAFEPWEYARIVFAVAQLGADIAVGDASLMPYLGFFNSVRSLDLDPGDLLDLSSLGERPTNLTELTVRRRARSSVRGIESWNGLEKLTIDAVHMMPDLNPIASIETLRSVSLRVQSGIAVDIDLRPLSRLWSLETLRVEVDTHHRLDLSPLATRAIKITVSAATELVGENRLASESEIVTLSQFG